MQGMFDQKRPDASATRKLKALISERLKLTETTTLSIGELRCHEPGCAPVETVITVRFDDASVKNWKIEKPVQDIISSDLEKLGF